MQSYSALPIGRVKTAWKPAGNSLQKTTCVTRQALFGTLPLVRNGGGMQFPNRFLYRQIPWNNSPALNAEPLLPRRTSNHDLQFVTIHSSA